MPRHAIKFVAPIQTLISSRGGFIVPPKKKKNKCRLHHSGAVLSFQSFINRKWIMRHQYRIFLLGPNQYMNSTLIAQCAQIPKLNQILKSQAADTLFWSVRKSDDQTIPLSTRQLDVQRIYCFQNDTMINYLILGWYPSRTIQCSSMLGALSVVIVLVVTSH